jgi:hypothetical protein
MIRRFFYITLLVGFLSGCVALETKQTKQAAFPSMYTDARPTSILILPAINKSTASDASGYITATLTQPFADAGYYVFPTLLTTDIFINEGILDGTQALGIPKPIFKKSFGADSVLFVTINKWDKNYVVFAGNVTVGISYVLISTITEDILWSYDQEVVVDTSGDSSAGLIGALIATAVSTAVQDYIPVAHQVNAAAVGTMPYGKYHPSVGQDGAIASVSPSAQKKALE